MDPQGSSSTEGVYDAGTDANDLLALIGLDDELLTSISNNGCSISECAKAATDNDYGLEEVRTLLEEWSCDPDSPFDTVPLLSDGRPDILEALVMLFDWMETFSFLRRNEDEVEGCILAKSNGNLVVAGLFLLHVQNSVLGRTYQAQTASQLYAISKRCLCCPVLALEFQSAARTGSCASARDMVAHGLAATIPSSETRWTRWLFQAMRPFSNWNNTGSVSGDVGVPFDTARLHDAVLAREVGLSVSTFLASDVHEFKVDGSLFSLGMHQNQDSVPTLPHFAMQVATKWTQSKSGTTADRFEVFCDALFLNVARRIKSNVGRGEEASVFMRAAKRALHDVVIKGLFCGAMATVQQNPRVLIDTLKQSNPALLSSLPDEIASHVFKDTLIAQVFNGFPKVQTRVPPNPSMSDSLKKIYLERTPQPGQLLTADNLLPLWDTCIFPVYDDYVRQVVRLFSASNGTDLQKRDSLPNVLAFLECGDELTLSNANELWDRVKATKLGVRHMFKYIAASNKLITNLRCVCKSYAAFFEDFVFRPYVDMQPFDESEADVFGSASLRGSPAMGLNFTKRFHKLHVYFARKTLLKDGKTDDLKEHWQYLNPDVVTVGCNSIKVTAETMPDANGNVTSFGVCPDGRCLRLPVYERHWHPTGDPHVEMQSLGGDAVYSLHSGSGWKSRCRQHEQRKLVVLWDKKIPCAEKYKHSQTYQSSILAKRQSIALNVRCPKTSASLAASTSAPMRPIRYRVTFGNVACEVPEDGNLDRIAPFTMAAISEFKPVVSGTTKYHYSSNISLKADAVSKRATKRKHRTEAERASRSGTTQ
jgi:hypothetical protein